MHLLTFFSICPWKIQITRMSSHNKEMDTGYCCMWTGCYLAKDICLMLSPVPHHRASPRDILMKYEIWSASSSSRGARCWNVRFWGRAPQNSVQGVTIFQVVWIYHIGFLLHCLARYQLYVNKMGFLHVSLCNRTVVCSSLRNFHRAAFDMQSCAGAGVSSDYRRCAFREAKHNNGNQPMWKCTALGSFGPLTGLEQE